MNLFREFDVCSAKAVLMVLILGSAEPMLGIKGEGAKLFSPLGSPIGEGIV
jgi:hypothetical protein